MGYLQKCTKNKYILKKQFSSRFSDIVVHFSSDF